MMKVISIKRFVLFALVVVLQLLGGEWNLMAQSVKIKRLNRGKPILTETNFLKAGYPKGDGNNINGPSVIKLPDWLPAERRVNRKAKYYLYFAHHHGSYLRLAWAEKLTGPYQLVGDSPLYGSHENAVLALHKIPQPVGEVFALNHVASPIVCVDDERKEFKLYFHAPARLAKRGKGIGQVTFFATSPDGLMFHKHVEPVYLGSFYFSPFSVRGRWYAFTNFGHLCEAPEEGEVAMLANFDRTKPLWRTYKSYFVEIINEYCLRNHVNEPFGVRHLSQFLKGDVLHVFFSSRDDTPERLYHLTIDVAESDCRKWKLSNLEMVMEAEEEWEGANLPPKKSVNGYSPDPLNEIRDTFVFQDERGKYYLFYCAGGERGIGIASLRLKDK